MLADRTCHGRRPALEGLPCPWRAPCATFRSRKSPTLGRLLEAAAGLEAVTRVDHRHTFYKCSAHGPRQIRRYRPFLSMSTMAATVRKRFYCRCN